MANYRAPTNIRFPPDLHAEIKRLAEEREVSFAQIVIEACYQYLDGNIPGLCPECHTQNNPEALYCQKCGQPLTCETVESLQHQLDELRSRFDESISMLKVAFKDKELIIGPDEGSKTLTAKIVDIQPDSKDE